PFAGGRGVNFAVGGPGREGVENGDLQPHQTQLIAKRSCPGKRLGRVDEPADDGTLLVPPTCYAANDDPAHQVQNGNDLHATTDLVKHCGSRVNLKAAF